MRKSYVILSQCIHWRENPFSQAGNYGLPHQWCSAQRIKISMIASGNHTLIQCGLVRNDKCIL